MPDRSSMVSMVNRLSTDERAQIVSCLCESMSIRATVRVSGAAKNTVTKLLVDLGRACAEYQDGALEVVKLRGGKLGLTVSMHYRVIETEEPGRSTSSG